MRIFAAAFIVWCLGAGAAQAGTEVRRVPTEKGGTKATIFVRPFCKFGLQFLAVTSTSDNGNYGFEDNVTVIQVNQKGGYPDQPSQPMKCQEDAAEPVVRYK